MSFHDLAREYSATTGTSNAVLSGAVPGCNTWDNAGVTNGETVSYAIVTFSTSSYRIPTGRETGTGTYTTSTKTLARTTVTSSTNGGSKISLTGFSHVFITPNKDDMDGWDAGGGGGGSSFAVYESSTATTGITNTSSSHPQKIDVERVDADGLFTLATNVLTCAVSGFYEFQIMTYITTAGAFGNGDIDIFLDSSTANTTTSTWPEVIIPTSTGFNRSTIWAHWGGGIDLDAGDTVEFWVTNNSAVTISVTMSNILIKKLG